jgi:hypothetical protein
VRGTKHNTIDERFWMQVERTESCWNWIGGQNGNGYGKFQVGGRKVYVHRWAYERFVGPIPDGLQVDHLCRNRACCNPEHLEPVTRLVNQLRGETIVAANLAKTHCVAGHELSGDNIEPRLMPWRICRECRRQRDRSYYERNRAKRVQYAAAYRKAKRALRGDDL